MSLAFLERYQVDTLPVDIGNAAKASGIFLLTYQEYARAVGTDPVKLMAEYNADGFTMYAGGRDTICYNPCNPKPRIRWTLAHELCHIFLGDTRGNQKSNPEADIRVDRMVGEVLAPLPVLQLCGVSSAEEIQALTGLSAEASGYRLIRLQEARASDSVFSSQEDTLIALRFLPFISRYISKKVTGGQPADIFRYDER